MLHVTLGSIPSMQRIMAIPGGRFASADVCESSS